MIYMVCGALFLNPVPLGQPHQLRLVCLSSEAVGVRRLGHRLAQVIIACCTGPRDLRGGSTGDRR